MSPFHKARPAPHGARERGVALLIVLSMIVIVSLILVAFVTAMRLERTASASYSQSVLADHLARGGLNLVVADLQNEMAFSSPPDLQYPQRPLFTNVGSSNILPQRIGTNPAMPLLVRISTNEAFTNAAGAHSHDALRASGLSSSTPSQNGRYVDAARWSAPHLGAFPSNALPAWVLIARGGLTNGESSTFSATGPSVNNPAPGNTNYVIGRFAYAVYDIGGLMDITQAGYPPGLTPGQVQSIKANLAGAEVSAVGVNAAALTAWRNGATATNASSFVDWITNGPAGVAPGDTTFLGRQDLIKAAQAGVAGLSTNVLTNLTVFSRERNAPSLMPSATNSTNVFFPSIRRPLAATITSYRQDGTAFTYPVAPGDPLVMRRFPLERLAWVGPQGPQNGGTAENIQACFGLLWDQASGVWKYAGATGSTEQASIKTLQEVVAEAPAREPNFFELLQAAIPTGSLGLEGGPNFSGSGASTYFTYPWGTIHEKSVTLHILRIGASILSQYDPSACPIVLEYDQSGGAWQAPGIDNLPYLNMVHFLTGSNSANSLGCYLVFGLWNPHRGTTTSPRPPVRLRIRGSVMVANAYGIHPNVIPYGDPSLARPGYALSLNSTINLSAESGKGANGFVDPHALLPDDLQPSLGAGSPAGLEWVIMPAIGGRTFAGFRLPDFVIDPARTPAPGSYSAYYNQQSKWIQMAFWASMDASNPFNCWLEYRNPDGTWVPYNYFFGINDEATWATKPGGFDAGYMGRAWSATNTSIGLPATPQPWDPPAALLSQPPYFRKHIWETADPRTLRFGPTQHATVTDTNWSSYLSSSAWSSQTDPTYRANGRAGHQAAQKIFGPPWLPPGLSRNNNASFSAGSTASPAAYFDRDGVRRIADSGLFTNSPPVSGWKGDPYALSTDRLLDRPVILNRPFLGVAELGYTCRDYPWRTLDLFTTNSADGCLLDAFSVGAGTNTVNSGKLQLNTRLPGTLVALLTNTFADSLASLPLSKPADVAAHLVTTTMTPLSSKAEIATRMIPGLPSSAFSGDDEEKVKTRRESIARALADVGQIRTWNLLIDVVAQSGRYSPAASSLDQFSVEGEKRYWMHVAIDRFTGEVLDRQIEPVSP